MFQELSASVYEHEYKERERNEYSRTHGDLSDCPTSDRGHHNIASNAEMRTDENSFVE